MLPGAALFVDVRDHRATRVDAAGLERGEHEADVALVFTLFIHSIPEGAAIGVGYATGEIKFGWLLAVAIGVHNIPEGTAVSLPLRANGASVWRCVYYSILTSLPQPIVAVPAFLLVSVFRRCFRRALDSPAAR